MKIVVSIAFALSWIIFGTIIGVFPQYLETKEQVSNYNKVAEVFDPMTLKIVHQFSVMRFDSDPLVRVQTLQRFVQLSNSHELFIPYKKHVNKVMDQLDYTEDSLKKAIDDGKKDASSLKPKKVPSNTQISMLREVSARILDKLFLELESKKQNQISKDDALIVSLSLGKQDKLVKEYLKILILGAIQSPSIISKEMKWTVENQPVSK